MHERNAHNFPLDLAAADSNGLSDPFCIVQCAGQKARTGIIYKDRFPVWDWKGEMVIDQRKLNEPMFTTESIGHEIHIIHISKIFLWNRSDRITLPFFPSFLNSFC